MRAGLLRATAVVAASATVVSVVSALVGPDPVAAVALLLSFPVPFFAVGLVAWRRAGGHPTARRLFLFGCLEAVVYAPQYVVNAVAPGAFHSPAMVGVVLPAEMLATVLLVRLVALLPDGRYRFRRERLVLRPMWCAPLLPLVVLAVAPDTIVRNPFLFDGLELAEVAAGLALFYLRFAGGSRADRVKVRWVAVAAVGGVVAVPVRLVVLLVVDSRAEQGPWILACTVAHGLVLLTGIVVAAVRDRLFDVDIVVRRSVTYRVLWLAVGTAYVASAALPGLTVGRAVPVEAVVMVSVAAAVLFAPLRARLAALARRLVFGPQVSSHELVARLGGTLERAFNPAELAPHLAEVVRGGLGLRWAAVELAGPDGPVRAGGGDDPVASVPLTHAGVVLGVVECGPKVDGAPLSAADVELVSTVARQAALAVHNVRQARELDESRSRILAAQDTERRRLERRLHDGVQQELVALVAKIRLARNEVVRSGGRDDALGEIQEDAYRVIDELREVAHGIQPPLLSDQGLVAAVRSRARRLPIPVVVDARASARYDVGVEESAYFLIAEALTNVLKHAGASGARVGIGHEEDALVVTVADDGCGLPDRPSGSGLTGMRDRVEAVGGALSLATAPGGGTTVTARFPR
ncbi:ATP-binding protein [Actinosynnema sp. NPDC050436]|uniref:sensor histidine kinase n=1 Tax=Actinosynnema sp. NPDC050436 TaxID=3155659 RepID=UPI0033FFB0F1